YLAGFYRRTLLLFSRAPRPEMRRRSPARRFGRHSRLPRIECRCRAPDDCRRRNPRRQHPQHLGPAGGERRDFPLTMKLRDIFAFRDPPESETSKPFLEHLEDLRWTIVKMAIVLIAAMFLCFAFRQRLVSILQRPLNEV